MATAATQERHADETTQQTAYVILDTESVPDGKLLGRVKYPSDNLNPEEAVARAQAEARELSPTGSDFLPVTFQIPVAICVVTVRTDFAIRGITCLDAPEFRPAQMVQRFWERMQKHRRAKIVTFNGRSFDLPLLELAAFRYGCNLKEYLLRSRHRYQSNHLDLQDWITNYGAIRFPGGLNLLAKLLGKPGKLDVKGDQVYALHQAGRLQEINDYCLFDTLDTYFVFLRSLVMQGDLSLKQEEELVARAKEFIAVRARENQALSRYLEHWEDWNPWP